MKSTGWQIGAALLIALFISTPAGAMLPRWSDPSHGGQVADLAISDDGSRAITGTMMGYARVYAANGSRLWEVRVPGTLLVGCLGDGDGFLLASREDPYLNKGALRMYDTNGSMLWFHNTGWIKDMEWCDQSGNILYGTRVGELFVLNVSGGEEATFNDFPKSYSITDLSLSDDGKYFAYSLDERNPQLKYIAVKSRSKTTFARFAPKDPDVVYVDDEPIRQVEVSGDGAFVATAGGEGSHGLICFYARDGTRLWAVHRHQVTDIEVNSNGSAVYAGSSEGEVTCFNSSGNLSWAAPARGPVEDLSLSGDGSLLAAGTGNGKVLLFNQTGGLCWSYQVPGFPNGEVTRVELSRDGRSLIALSNGRMVWFFSEDEVLQPVPPEGDGGWRMVVPARNKTVTEEATMSPEPRVCGIREAVGSGPGFFGLGNLTAPLLGL